MTPFLTARWSYLVNLTYAVPPDLLTPHLPPGLELDTRDGEAYASLVFFHFLETRLMGIPVPGHRNFPEINLRFYVREPGGRRGVVFIKELVPRPAIAWVARWVYNEPYEATRMQVRIDPAGEGVRRLTHRFRYGGRWHTLAVDFGETRHLPEPDSLAHFFKEHEWGYGQSRRGVTSRYQVTHPVWEVFEWIDYDLDVDTGKVYGPQWAFLATATPKTALLAAGSPVAVYPAQKLTTQADSPAVG